MGVEAVTATMVGRTLWQRSDVDQSNRSNIVCDDSDRDRGNKGYGNAPNVEITLEHVADTVLGWSLEDWWRWH